MLRTVAKVPHSPDISTERFPYLLFNELLVCHRYVRLNKCLKVKVVKKPLDNPFSLFFVKYKIFKYGFVYLLSIIELRQSEIKCNCSRCRTLSLHFMYCRYYFRSFRYICL